MNWLKWKILVIKVAILVVPLACLFFALRALLPEARRMYSQKQFKGEVREWESEHFRYFSRKFEEQDRVTSLVEGYYRAFMSEYGEDLGLYYFDKIKPEIHIYGDKREFQEYYKSRYGKYLEHNDAYYEPLHHKIVLYWPGELQIRSVLQHELTHLVLDMGSGNSNPRYSTWLNEGLAGYFERCELSAGKLVPALLTYDVRKRLEQRMPISQLLRATSRNFQSDGNIRYYYQSYFLVYFLLHAEHGNYKSKFYRYFREEKKIGPCSPEMFWGILGEQPPSISGTSELDERCHRFLLSFPR